MKRQISILCFLIIFLMLFTSCNSVEEPSVQPSETSASETRDVKPTESETALPTEPLYYTDGDNNLLVREFELSIDNYSDYQKFISEVNLPDHFVKYEDISSLGNFKRFYIYQSNPDTTKKEKFRSINYAIEAEHDYVFTVTIVLPTSSDVFGGKDHEVSEKDIDFSNMRGILNAEEYDELIKNTLFEVLVYNCSSNLRYAYLIPGGKLSNVRIYHGELEINFVIPEDYPDISDDLISKLLNIEDNDPAEVVASITKNIKAE